MMLTVPAALAHAVALLEAQGFTVVARNTRGDSTYLKPEGCAFALRVSNHPRTPKQRKNHPDAITSLVIRDRRTEAGVAAMVAEAVRNFEGALRVREAMSPTD